MNNFIEFKINNHTFVTCSDISIIESCKFTGIQIPRFCYQEGLAIAGNCRMCLVELAFSDKLVIACMSDIESEAQIYTNTFFVKKARENILESLLLNHPLDCPICDQAGECDLQNQTKEYGSNYNKIFVKRRSVEDKHFSSLIKTIMTRCIHCTRCVRFSTDILDLNILGTLNRGNMTEIGVYKKQNSKSNAIGNLIDLCPVGALTSKAQAYQIRPWELRSVETIDLTDSYTNNIFVNFKETEIVRILPKPTIRSTNLISDKARFCYDALNNNRIYNQKKLSHLTWKNVCYNYYNTEKSSNKLLILINEQIDLFLLTRLKFLSTINNSIFLKNLVRFNEFKNHDFFLNDLVTFFDQNFNSAAILIGSKHETEIEVLNTKIRIKNLTQDYQVYKTNNKYFSKRNFFLMNVNITEVFLTFEGKFKTLSKALFQENAPQIIIGESFKKRFFNLTFLKTFLKNINTNITSFVTNLSLNTEGSFFLGIKSVNLRDIFMSENFFFINLNENILFRKIFSTLSGKKFWFNSHVSGYPIKKDIILPVFSNFFEKNGTFLNLEQTFQKSQKVLFNENNLNYIEVFIKIYTKTLIRFNFLKFIKKRKEEQSQNEFLSSFRFKLKKENLYAVSKYPLKFYFQDFVKTDNFLSQSYILVKNNLSIEKNI